MAVSMVAETGTQRTTTTPQRRQMAHQRCVSMVVGAPVDDGGCMTEREQTCDEVRPARRFGERNTRYSPTSVSTRRLIILSLLCGVAILAAFVVQLAIVR
jgi:hypothetical protein